VILLIGQENNTPNSIHVVGVEKDPAYAAINRFKSVADQCAGSFGCEYLIVSRKYDITYFSRIDGCNFISDPQRLHLRALLIWFSRVGDQAC
jgi:hypothetical protein